MKKEKITLKHLKILFSIETHNPGLTCKDCKYKKYVVCCPEEGNCQVDNEWTIWLQNKLIKEMNKK